MRHEGGVPAVRLITGSRLHLGLLDVSGVSGRRFGGAGIMVEEPSVEVRAVRKQLKRKSGPLEERASRAAQCVSERLGHTGESSIEVIRCPRPHTGLGTGTQLDLAVATALRHLHDFNADTADLAKCVGRGSRSAIGVHGFQGGGFVVDAGKQHSDEIAPLVTRLEVPSAWRFVLVTPKAAVGLSGNAESEAFRELTTVPIDQVDTLCRLLLFGLIPALLEANIDTFGEIVQEYGHRASEPFRKAQGGTFAHPVSRQVVEFIRKEGVQGTGQSSWGPTCYAVIGEEDHARRLAVRLRERFGLGEDEVVVTAARNYGAQIARYVEPA